MSLSNKLLSGIEINQNRADAELTLGTTPIYQEFRLPENIERGADNSEILIPPLSGFSFLSRVSTNTAEAVVVDWALERYLSSSGWVELTSGSCVGAQAEGSKVWFDIYFDDLITVDPALLTDILRIKIVGRASGGYTDRVVQYSGGYVEGSEGRFAATLVKDEPYLYVSTAGVKLVYTWSSDDGVVRESIQQNVAGVWYAT